MERNLVLKILLLGAQGSGKSSICRRYENDSFVPTYSPTVGIDLHTVALQGMRHLCVAGTEPYLQLWDVAHAELFGNHVEAILHEASAVIMVADLSNFESLAVVDAWREVIALRQSRRVADLPIFLVLNKKDSLRHVTAKVANETARVTTPFTLVTASSAAVPIARTGVLQSIESLASPADKSPAPVSSSFLASMFRFNSSAVPATDAGSSVDVLTSSSITATNPVERVSSSATSPSLSTVVATAARVIAQSLVNRANTLPLSHSKFALQATRFVKKITNYGAAAGVRSTGSGDGESSSPGVSPALSVGGQSSASHLPSPGELYGSGTTGGSFHSNGSGQSSTPATTGAISSAGVAVSISARGRVPASSYVSLPTDVMSVNDRFKGFGFVLAAQQSLLDDYIRQAGYRSWLFTSARSGHSVRDAIDSIVSMVLVHRQQQQNREDPFKSSVLAKSSQTVGLHCDLPHTVYCELDILAPSCAVSGDCRGQLGLSHNAVPADLCLDFLECTLSRLALRDRCGRCDRCTPISQLNAQKGQTDLVSASLLDPESTILLDDFDAVHNSTSIDNCFNLDSICHHAPSGVDWSAMHRFWIAQNTSWRLRIHEPLSWRSELESMLSVLHVLASAVDESCGI